MTALPFDQVWAIDCEFVALRGERPKVVCMVGRELNSGRRIRYWAGEFPALPPFPIDKSVLFVAHFSSAEWGCFKALGWPPPPMVLDTFCEFRGITNGLPAGTGGRQKVGLAAVLNYYGLSHLFAAEKSDLQQRIGRGDSFDAEEREMVLRYCEADVDALASLLPRMWPEIAPTPKRLGQALLRGRFMRAVAEMEWAGVPIDTGLMGSLREHWDQIKLTLIRQVDARYGVFEEGSLRQSKLELLVKRMGIEWPRTATGMLSTENDTFKDQARLHPALNELKELISTLGQARLFDLAIGADGRNRTLLSPFSSISGRSQPSSRDYVFGPSVWIRHLIKPPIGRSLAYLDWSSQEVWIAAALSGDARLLQALKDGDVYLGFAKLAGLVPPDAIRKDYEAVRDACKVLFLATGYGMGRQTLAASLGRSDVEAQHLLDLYRQTFATRMAWSQQVCDVGMLGGELQTVFGWPIHVNAGTKARTLKNWPMQANGAEMMRLAACLVAERGISLIATAHDALLIEAASDQIEQAVFDTKACMNEASRIVLDGLEVTVDDKIVTYPNHFFDKRGVTMFDKVMKLLGEVQALSA